MSDPFHGGLMLDIGAIDAELHNLTQRIEELNVAALGNAALPTIKAEMEQVQKYAARIVSVAKTASERVSIHINRREARAA